MKLSLKADSVKVVGPKVDGGYSVTFGAGENEAVNVAKLLAIPKQSIINIEMQVEEADEGYKEEA